MNKFPFFTIALAVLLAFSSCKPDDDDNTVGTVKLNLNAHVDGENFAMRTNYTGPDGVIYKSELMRFYISNIKLIKDDNTEVDFLDVALIDLEDAATLSYETDLDAGSFKGIKFGLGLDAEMNASDPVTFEPTHPLSSLQNTYWSWNSKYRFVMYEGRSDTSGTGTNFDNSFVFHTGLDTLYREVTLSNRSFTLAGDEVYNFDLNLDIQKLFYGDFANIDYVNDWITHTTDNYPLAEQLTENMVGAFE